MTGRNAIFITIIIIIIIGLIMFAALPDTPPAAGAATPVGVRAAIHSDETAALTKETVGNSRKQKLFRKAVHCNETAALT